MTFNAKWELEELSDEKTMSISYLLSNFLTDIKKMVDKLSVYRLKLKANQTAFKLYDAMGKSIQKDAIYTGPGLYIIFSCSHAVYVGEASNLQRRQFQDPDNTADSTKRFNAQARAILKYLMKEKIEESLSLSPLFIQIYPGDYKLNEKGENFKDFYRLDKSKYRKCFEGILKLSAGSYHIRLNERAKTSGFNDIC